jgi:hypothetical protein
MTTVTNKYFKQRAAVARAAVAPTSVAAATGTLTRTTFATGSVTLPQLAERLAALLADLKTAGVIK